MWSAIVSVLFHCRMWSSAAPSPPAKHGRDWTSEAVTNRVLEGGEQPDTRCHLMTANLPCSYLLCDLLPVLVFAVRSGVAINTEPKLVAGRGRVSSCCHGAKHSCAVLVFTGHTYIRMPSMQLSALLTQAFAQPLLRRSPVARWS